MFDEGSLRISTASTLTAGPASITAVILAMLVAPPNLESHYDSSVANCPIATVISNSMEPLSAMDCLSETKNGRLAAIIDAKLKEFGELSEGWNGYDAASIPADAIASAKLFLQNLVAYRIDLDGWKVFPTGRESVQFEKTENEIYVEVEIYSNGRFAFYSEGTKEIELDSINLMETMQRVSSVFV